MSFTEILILVATGLAAGVVGGMFGVGGGILVVPALVFIFGMTQHAAQGTSIGMMLLPIGIFAAWNYYQSGNLNVKFCIVLALAFIIGAYFGSKISLGISELTLKRIFGALMMVVAVKLMFFPK